MSQQAISFSSDTRTWARTDFDITSKFTEDYFGTEQDPQQIRTSPENRDWLYNNMPYSVNVIRDHTEIVGFSFILPCTNRMMEQFLSLEIDEATLFEEIKGMSRLSPPEAIYLCSAVLKEEYRGRGLATLAFVKSISQIKGDSDPILFYWKFSDEGERLAKRVARQMGLELRARNAE